MVTLAVDYGDRHLGLAVSTIAGPMPLDPVDIKTQAWNQRVAHIVDQYEIGSIIVGYSSGNAELLAKVKAFCTALEGLTSLPVELVDESMTSQWAESVLRSLELPSRAVKAKSHSIAAVKLLIAFEEGKKRGIISFTNT